MNAAVIVRCSGSLFFSSTCARVATGMARRDVELADVSPTPGARPRSTSGGDASRIAASFRWPDAAGIEPARQRLGDSDLAGVRDGLHLERLGHRRAARSAARGGRCRSARSGRPPSRSPTDIRRVSVPLERWSRPTRSIVRCISQAARQARRSCSGSVEQEEQRVAAPLEEAGAPVVRLVEQRAEHAVEGVAHQLGADLALAGEPLAERGEAGDVDEDEGRRRAPCGCDPGRVRSQSMTSRGTYAVSTFDAAADDDSAGSPARVDGT